ncbi:MAG: hypothetical protein MZV63_18230 [Marinilabiliales bacterium]|nr:hypothetical protein [Marinilabiliales bacterium]
MLREPREGVVVEHLGPQVGVVPGRVAVRPDVEEVAGAVPRRHLGQVEAGLTRAPPPRRRRPPARAIPAGSECHRMSSTAAREDLRQAVALVERRARSGSCPASACGIGAPVLWCTA